MDQQLAARRVRPASMDAEPAVRQARPAQLAIGPGEIDIDSLPHPGMFDRMPQ
jgi:hypothetical protein